MSGDGDGGKVKSKEWLGVYYVQIFGYQPPPEFAVLAKVLAIFSS